MLVAIGVLICLGSYLAGRALARRLLGIPGVSPVAKDADDGYFEAPGARRLAWRLAGPVTAYLVAVGLALLSVRAAGDRILTTQVGVVPDGPAEAAGLQAGDRVVAVGGVATATWRDVQADVAAAGPGHPVSVSVRRDGAELSLTVTTNASGRIGISPRSESAPTPIGRALRKAIRMPITTAVHTARSEWSLFSGERKEDLIGPVGIVRELSTEGTRPGVGTRFALMLLAYPAALVWPLTLFVELLLAPRRRRRGDATG
jgi:membrane-associated protease RseP (regulator of RpoE activity)